MTGETTREAEYTMGYNEEFQQLLYRRSAATHAAHLLPHLKPGMRVLDLGCGPGTISVGLADAVSPGEVRGVDLEESEVAKARAAAEAGGHANATFDVGDATDLPFGDGEFDVVHCHAVLMHIPDTAAALAEVRRVLKPGGLFAARELILDSCFLEPVEPEVHEAWTIFGKLLEANGGHPQMGRELKRVLLDAGFTGIQPSGTFGTFGTDEDVAFFHGFVVDWFFQPHIIAAAIHLGISTQEQFDFLREAVDEWGAVEGAVGALAFGEAIATSP